ncbi:MAG: hypothetical protein R6X02_21395 [Enhygromyxa sp.]
MHDRRLTLSLSVLVAAAGLSFATPAHAGGQATAGNPPPALRPGKTNTVHEIGASLNGSFNPDAFIPAFNWRFHLPGTGRIGPLSGLYMGFNIGPAVSFYGRGRARYYDGPRRRGDYYRGPYWDDDYYYRSVWGRAGFELGYEIDPWSNLALTFSPVVHNDFHFSPYFFQFAQTFGPAIRLYINQNWIVYFEPGFLGWNAWTNGYYSGAGFSVRGGAGFAYKF